MLTYQAAYTCTEKQTQALFESVGWQSARYPARLHRALQNSDTVLTAWDGDRLVGLINAIDDGEMTAYVHYLLVHPEYQGRGVGRTLLEQLKERYASFYYLLLVAEHEGLIAFYERAGMNIVKGGTVMAIRKP